MATNRIAIQKPYPFTSTHPKFRVRGWRELLGKSETIAAEEMVRHFLATGETGCGKSLSVVMRLLESVLRYPEDDLYGEYSTTLGEKAEPQELLRPSVLIVDPKQELGPVVEKEARGRKVTKLAYGETGPVFHMFEGRDLSRITATEALDLILAQSDFFTRDQATSREPSWGLQGAAAIADFIAVDMWLARQGAEKLRELWDRVSETVAKSSECSSIAPGLKYDPVNYFKPMATMFALSSSEGGSYPIAVYLDMCTEMEVPGDLMLGLIGLVSLWHSTRSGVVWMASGILDALAQEEFAACVSLNPIEPPPAETRLSLKDAVNSGDIVVYVPTIDPSSIGDMVARCLKTKMFEFSFQRENKARPFFYVVDEFHRFIAAGEQDGEQSLLDRCRAYRTGGIFASQSIASMAYRLQNEPAGGRNALDIILNNCGNSLFFRTADIQTQSNVESRIPAPPMTRRPHVIRVRPLASLHTGVCYALRCDGSWGLFKIHLPDS